MEYAIDLENVTVRYDGNTVLESIDFQVEQGKFIGLIGPNGGGKTTLLKVILGMIKPEEGVVKVFGNTPQKHATVVGYVPQYATFDMQFPINVEQVVMMGRLGEKGFRPFFKGEDRRRAKKALEEVDMLGYKDRQISKLSGGQLQRVLIARALASEPKVLLLDEPTASIDKQMEDTIYDILVSMKKDMTMILVTHDIGVVSAYVDAVGCINKKLFFTGGKEISHDMLEEAYQCPVELIAHGIPHRVLPEHRREEEK